jgi:hypothetical protein
MNIKVLKFVACFIIAIVLCAIFFPVKPSNHSRNSNTTETPAPIKEWPGKWTKINQGERTQTYLFDYDGRKYILVMSMSNHDMVMVEHKGP